MITSDFLLCPRCCFKPTTYVSDKLVSVRCCDLEVQYDKPSYSVLCNLWNNEVEKVNEMQEEKLKYGGIPKPEELSEGNQIPTEHLDVSTNFIRHESDVYGLFDPWKDFQADAIKYYTLREGQSFNTDAPPIPHNEQRKYDNPLGKSDVHTESYESDTNRGFGEKSPEPPYLFEITCILSPKCYNNETSSWIIGFDGNKICLDTSRFTYRTFDEYPLHLFDDISEIALIDIKTIN